MLFSGGACSRRVSLFKAVLFSAKMRKARERERKSWELGESGRILSSLFCFVWNAAGGRKEAKKTSKSFLEMKKKNEFFFSIFFLFSFFFSRPRETHKHTGTILLFMCA